LAEREFFLKKTQSLENNINEVVQARANLAFPSKMDGVRKDRLEELVR